MSEVADDVVSLRGDDGNLWWATGMDVSDNANGTAVGAFDDPEVIAGSETVICAKESVVVFWVALSELL